MKSRSVLCGLILAVLLRAEAQEAAEGRFEKFRSGFNIDTLALQVLLDRNNLSCNCADGKWGARTEIALVTWQTLNGLPVTGIPDTSVLQALGGATNILTRYTVTEADLTNSIAAVPVEWEERSKLSSLKYETIQEMLAEKGHTSQRAIDRAAGLPIAVITDITA